jgi:CheY-like chemotaxis protein
MKKIIHFENDKMIAEMYKLKLKKYYSEDIEYYHYGDPSKNPVNLVKKHMPDLIMMDMVMPIMDGLKATELLKNNSITKHIPIFGIGNFSFKEDINKGLRLGMIDCWEMLSHMPDEIINKIKLILENKDKKDSQLPTAEKRDIRIFRLVSIALTIISILISIFLSEIIGIPLIAISLFFLFSPQKRKGSLMKQEENFEKIEDNNNTNNKIEKSIENIGRLNYTWTIITGKNKELTYLAKNDTKIDGSFILTLGKNAVILTDIINGKRIPIIVRKWKKTDEFAKFENINVYKDSSGFIWRYLNNVKGNEHITLDDDEGNEIYNMFIFNPKSRKGEDKKLFS